MYYPYARPLYVMAKAAGPLCNLRCQYCYYLEKQSLDPPQSSLKGRESERVWERYIRDYIELQQTPDVLFTWHGGEPMLRSLDFYRQVVRLQQYYGRGKRISNSIQTNGLLLTPEWCRFLHDEGWLVGISIDGTREQHDAYRRDAQGRGTWERVVQAIRMLDEYGVEWNAMATANHVNAQDPLGFYRFFRDELHCRYLQVTPVVERFKEHSDGRRLAHLFDEDCPLAPFSIRPEECGHAAVMEQNGDVYSCDHFVFPEYRLGNIRTHGLPEMLYGAKQNRFSRLKKEALPRQCRQCEWLKACHGECPRLRFLHTADGEPGLNYLCAGYRIFFQHVAPFMDYMRGELLAGRPASGVMRAF